MIVLLVCILQLPVLSNIQEQQGDSTLHKLTVARVIDKPKEGYTEVIFLESARYYKLLHTNVKYTVYLNLLREAVKNKSVVQIRFSKPNGDIIAEVHNPKKT